MKPGSKTRYIKPQTQLRLQEQAQMAYMLISELRRALKETADQATANTRNTAELEVQLRKEILEAHHRLAELEPAWDMFIAKLITRKGGARARTASQSGGGCAAFGASQSRARRRFRSSRFAVVGEQSSIRFGRRYFALGDTSRRGQRSV